jgi:hypothetical protein
VDSVKPSWATSALAACLSFATRAPSCGKALSSLPSPDSDGSCSTNTWSGSPVSERTSTSMSTPARSGSVTYRVTAHQPVPLLVSR